MILLDSIKHYSTLNTERKREHQMKYEHTALNRSQGAGMVASVGRHTPLSPSNHLI